MSDKQLSFQTTLEDMADILDKHHINFYLYCGTALGAHREGRFIEHDPDIDLAVFKNDENFVDITKKVESSGLFKLAQTFPWGSKLNEATEITFIHRNTGIRIDIFQIVESRSTYEHYSYTSICEKKPNRRCRFVYPKFKTVNKQFLGRRYQLPDTSFLKNHYGDDWKKVKKFTYQEGLKKKFYTSLQ